MSFLSLRHKSLLLVGFLVFVVTAMILLKYRPILPYYNHLLVTTIRQQSQNMVAPRSVAKELLKKRKEDKSKAKGTFLNKCDFQVIGSSYQGSTPSLLVNSEGNAYLFNCGEGTQRNCYANRVKLSNLEHLFVTKLHWPAVSGAYGLALTLQDVGLPSFTIHSTGGISDFFKSTEYFINFTSGIDCNTKDCSATDFDDSRFRVKCIPLDDKFDNNYSREGNVSAKKARKAPTLVAFHCSLPDLPGTLDPQRCRELRVPIGPKLALLKSGCDVTLDDGTVVKSSEVCGPPNVGPNFIVIDCPTLQDIKPMVRNESLNCLQKLRKQNNEREVDLVIHFSPEGVTNDSEYMNWMDRFSDQCKHILLSNSEFKRLNFVDSYRLQYLLRKLEPELFTTLHIPPKLSDIIENEIKESSKISTNLLDPETTELKFLPKCRLEDQDRVIKASTFDRFSLRPNRICEFADPNMSIDALYNEALLEGDFEKTFSRYRLAVESLPAPQAHEPEIVFLGTGSALPSKLRNTSCIIVNTYAPKRATVILDCGEDSYGQIVRHYGPDGARQILENLKMIYVSHHHADHHIGLIEILRQRRRVVSEGVVQLLIPPGIDTHLDYYNDSFEDLRSTYSITYTKDLKLRSLVLDLPKTLVKNLCKSLDGLLKDISIVGVEHCANSCAVVMEFNISRPGMDTFKLAYSGDARPSEDFAKIGDQCDLLIHEATFDHKEMAAALEKKHSTTSEAIELSKKMRAKFTILTHFSQKYPKIPYFTNEFDETVGFAFDNMAIRCPSQLARLPMMKDLLSVVFAKSLNDIDVRHNRVECRRKILTSQCN
jgi:ribonuclease Z